MAITCGETQEPVLRGNFASCESGATWAMNPLPTNVLRRGICGPFHPLCGAETRLDKALVNTASGAVPRGPVANNSRAFGKPNPVKAIRRRSRFQLTSGSLPKPALDRPLLTTGKPPAGRFCPHSTLVAIGRCVFLVHFV